MFRQEVTAQNEIAHETKDRIVIEVLVSAFATVLMTILSLIGIAVSAIASCSLVMSGVIYYFCRREFNDAIISVFQKQPSNDSFNVAALIANALHSIALLFMGNGFSYSPIIFLAITLSMIMKLIFAEEIIKNLNLVLDNSVFLVEMGKVNLARRFVSRVCIINPIIRFPDVIGDTYAEDPSEEKNKNFVPVIIIAAFVIPFVVLIIYGGNAFFNAFAAMFAVIASFTGEMTFVMPYLIAQYKLRRLGSVLFGYQSLTRLKDIDTLMVKDIEMFPVEDIVIEKIRISDLETIFKAVEYTASVFAHSGAPESNCFLGFIKYGKRLIPAPDKIKNLSGYGYIADFGQDSVIIGSRSLMLSHNIEVYPQEKEAALSTEGSLMYCAVNGKMSASYIFTYKADRVMKRSAEQIGGDFNIIIDTTDCNITESFVRKKFDMQNASVIVPDTEESNAIREMRQTLEVEDSPCMISTERSIGILEAVRHAKNLLSIIEYAILACQIGIVLGMVLTFVALLINPVIVTPVWVFVYNLIWVLPILFLSFVKSKTAK